MAAHKFRKEKSSTFKNHHNSDFESARSARDQNKQHDCINRLFPEQQALQLKDNEIHFLRLFSVAIFLALILLYAFHRYKISQLAELLEAKEQQYMHALSYEAVSTREDTPMYMMMVDQFLSLIYIIAIVVGVITWW